MHLISDGKVKTKANAAPGDLVRVAIHGGNSLGIVVPPQAAGQPLRVVLMEARPPNGRPFLMINLTPDFVVNFGNEWILEAVHDRRVFVGNREGINELGVLRMTTDGTYMHCASTGPFDDEFYLRLEDFTDRDMLPNGVAPVFAWKIWANESHRARNGAEPLMAFSLNVPGN